LLANLYFFVDTLVILYRANFRIENVLIMRKLFSINLWHEADVMFPVVVVWSTGILFCAMLHNLQQWQSDKMVAMVGADGTAVRMVQNGKGMQLHTFTL